MDNHRRVTGKRQHRTDQHIGSGGRAVQDKGIVGERIAARREIVVGSIERGTGPVELQHGRRRAIGRRQQRGIPHGRSTPVGVPVIIGPDKKVKLMITYPASTGRNFVEVLRVIDSLQLTANYSVATPANWVEGEDVIVVPAVKTEDALVKFPKGLNIVKPYLRYTPQPNK